ncbi:MAG: cupredoxin domain-containing protein [Marinicella sp.]
MKVLFFGLFLSFSVYAETFNVTVSGLRFTPNDLEIEVGDTVIWTIDNGFHDVTADDGSFSSGAPSSSFTIQQTFNNVGEVFYHCSVHSSAGQNINTSMNGRINVVMPQVDPEPTFEINQGIAGSWFFPETTGSGFLIDVRPADQFIFAAWFTHDVTDTDRPESDTGTRWYTVAGGYAGNTAVLDMFETTGGLFDSPQAVSTTAVGSVTFEFADCSNGEVSYEFTDSEELAGTFPIQRAVPGTESLCESLDDSNATELN